MTQEKTAIMAQEETAFSAKQTLCAAIDFSTQAPPQEKPLPEPVTPYVGTLPIPPTVCPDNSGYLKMQMVPATAQLHPELPDCTNVWIYRAEGSAMQGTQVPIGPTIEVNSGVEARVAWKNALCSADGQPAKHPVVAVHDLPGYVKFQSNQEVHAPENLPGFTLGMHDHSAAALPPWTVVHLHGGRSEANSDGWPENAIYPGQVQRDTYSNNQPGTLLWYHDHAMSFTRLNVYAGLAGFYLIRDPRERELNLPCGSDDDELLLLLQDRTLTCAGDHPDISAGQLLHKTGTAGQDTVPDHPNVMSAPMEFFGSLTMVNGCIWPRHSVKAGVYRLRILNGCSARTYRLRFTDSDHNLIDIPMQMIGSDGGLLAKPFDLNDKNRPDSGSITLAPAERVDVLVDFSAIQGSVELRNFAASPFGGKDANPDDPLADFLTYPQVMRFDIEGKGLEGTSSEHQFLDPNQELLPSATPWNPADVQGVAAVERLLALVEDDAGVLQLMECAPLKDRDGNPRVWDGSPLPIGQLALQQRGEVQAKLYCLLPGMFSDPVRFLARDGDVEIWKIINLSEDTHPVHIHLIQFKLLSRDSYSSVQRLPDPSPSAPGGGYETHFQAAVTALDEADRGWKDTIRVNPMELTTIAVPFRDYAPSDTTPQSGAPIGVTGRYVYHCHILEHEDHEMMRPYVVMPPQVVEHMQDKMSHVMHARASKMPDQGTMPYDGWYMEPNLCCCDSDSSMPHD